MEVKIKNKIEAILFLSAEPVLVSQMAEKLGLAQESIVKELNKLQEGYQKDNSTFSLVFDQKEVQIVTNPNLSGFLEEYFNLREKEPISQAMLEVLSIVCYKGPATRTEIENIRGVDCRLILKKLAIKGLVIKEEKIKNSKVFNYRIGTKFLKNMGISKLGNLPDYDKLKDAIKNE